jgi:lysophospholipase L1-like esterase
MFNGFGFGGGFGRFGTPEGGGGAAPVNSVAPTTSGLAVVGARQTASPGTWSGSPTFAYQWTRNGVDIDPATELQGRTATYKRVVADIGATLACRVTATNGSGSASATTANLAATTLNYATLPTVTHRWHMDQSTLTTGVDSVPTTPVTRVLNVTDLAGALAMTGAATTGAKLRTDAFGRKFLRFEAYEFMTLASFVSQLRTMSVWIVGRSHASTNLPSGSWFSLGGGAAAGVCATNQPTATGAAPLMRTNGAAAASTTEFIIGSQLQVMGFHSRVTGAGGSRFDMNGNTVTGLAQTAVNPSSTFAEIGRNAFTPGTAGAWATFDVYEMIVVNGGQTDADALTTRNALVAAWNIPATANQLILDGDSITQQVGNTPTQTPDGPYRGNSVAMCLTNPSITDANTVPDGWRVVSVGISGDQVPSAVTRRDFATGWANLPLSGGRNVVFIQIGGNDITTGGQTGLQAYNRIVGYWNQTLSGSVGGVLQKGWEGKSVFNIARGNVTVQAQNQIIRDNLALPAFLTDCDAGPGQTYDGKLGRIRLDLQENPNVPGDTLWLTSADTADLTWFQPDATHPSAAGNQMFANLFAASL